MSLATEVTLTEDQRFIRRELGHARDPARMADDMLYLFRRYTRSKWKKQMTFAQWMKRRSKNKKRYAKGVARVAKRRANQTMI